MTAASWPAPMVLTKLYPPPMSADHVSRERLLELMDRSLDVPLTMVSAPAGYGKSALASEWIENRRHRAAWLSLDESDGELRQFLGYLATAVDSVCAGTCQGVRRVLERPEKLDAAVASCYLIEDLDRIDGPLVLVLDDYHRLERSSAVQELVALVLEHPPRNAHFVILSRRDPPLPLVRARASARLLEFRMRDLRFSPAETQQLLGVSVDQDIGDEALANLDRQIEGWPAGLRLVLLALRHVADANDFLRSLRGGLPQTREYLTREVLVALEPQFRQCLLKSSVLENFCAEVIDVVCCEDGPQACSNLPGLEFVEQLQRLNLFVIPLDPAGEWFRYHHLIRELLFARLCDALAPSDVEKLKRRASRWFEAKELIDPALTLLADFDDPADAVEIIARHRFAALNEDRWLDVRRWLSLLPEAVIGQHFELLLGEAWVSHFVLDTRQVRAITAELELLGDQATTAALAAELEFFRGFVAFWDGNSEESVGRFRAAIAGLPDDRGVCAGEASVYYALAQQMAGHGASGVAFLDDKIWTTDPANDVYLARMAAGKACVEMLAGDLQAVAQDAQSLETHARVVGAAYPETWGRYLQALAQLHRLELDDALRGFSDVSVRRDFVDRRMAVDALAGLALTHQLQQRSADAMKSVDDLDRFAASLAEAEYITVAKSCRARVTLLQGRHDRAVAWASTMIAEPDLPGMLFWVANPVLTRARVQIVAGDEQSVKGAIVHLEYWRRRLAARHQICQVVEAGVLQALALQRLGDRDQALATLRGVVEISAAGGWVRPFAEAGRPILDLLDTLAGQGGEAAQLLSRVRSAGAGQAGPTAAIPAEEGSRVGVNTAAFAAGLTNREMDVLELLAERHQNKEIAARLYIAPETVGYHLKHIYQKLAVNNRRAAVVRAVELGLIPGS